MSILRQVKRMILKSGIPPFPRIDFLNSLLAYGQWLRDNKPPVHLEIREKLYDHVASKLNGEPFDYIEAGVFKGESMRYWTGLSKHPESRFFGFDTFHGLPAPWQTGLKTFPIGHFDAGGVFPKINDSRVEFIKGKFQETVPAFLQHYRRQANLVVHCDADVYSSTLYFLTSMHGILTPGTYLLFDNFSVAPHDFRAFVDYTKAFCRKFELVATAECDYERIAFRLK